MRSRRPTMRRLELRPRPPFRLDLTVWALRRRDQNRIDSWDGRSYRRALIVDGAPLEMSVTQFERASTPRLEVVLTGPDVTSCTDDAVRSTLARFLGFDLHLSSFYARAARDRALDELAERYRGVKPPRFPTIFECLLNAVAYQQLSLAAGLMLLNRLAATAGAPAGDLHAFQHRQASSACRDPRCGRSASASARPRRSSNSRTRRWPASLSSRRSNSSTT